MKSFRFIDQMSVPSKATLPLVGRARPAAIRAAVVLPEPLSPTRQSTSPGLIDRSMLSTARIGPALVSNTWLTPPSVISGVPGRVLGRQLLRAHEAVPIPSCTRRSRCTSFEWMQATSW